MSESPLLSSYPPYPIELDRAEGCELIAKNGKRYVDFYGGHCVCILGHNPPGLRDALNKQMDRITFYSAALPLPEREQAARELLSISPKGFGKVFFVNSGAEANENALKFAFAATGRSTVVAVEGAFHGRTAGTDPLCGGPHRTPHYPHPPFHIRWVEFGNHDALEEALERGDVAAVILEPVQSMAGCRTHPPEFVQTLNTLAKKHGTLVIADEIQGGLGRCGAMWSHEALGMNVDLITTAKGVGLGFPVAALISHSRFGEPGKGLFGSTFGGGPLACAAVSAACKAVAEKSVRENTRKVSEVFDRLREVKGVKELLGLGLLRGVRVSKPAKEVKDGLFARGFIVGGSNDPEVIRLMPPLTLSV
ncbi:MAG: aspartate aminotransferase family protein, partial [Planctomycetaceae bacterium]|nr:aspartate aminotransferase family protein [Planctomycetaceae bacterium]